MRDVIGRFDSTTLAGRDLVVPDDLDRPTLVVFAYQQAQQRHVDTWLAVLADARADVDVLEVPVLGRRWRPVRRFIDGGMASRMDSSTREQTMCVYTDVAAFRRDVLGVSSTDVLAAMVERDGRVVWHAFGPATPSGADGLRDALAGGSATSS